MGNSTPSTTRALPDFNEALGDFLKLPANLQQTYTDVLTQVYPLPADFAALSTFCDAYLNNVSPGCPWRFEPAAPWVLLEVCNYGRMALQTQNVGWVSQHELAFGFPIAWYEGGKFKDWAMVYPYIYVDDPLSMSLGRQVYGWPKAGIELLPPQPNLEPDLRCLVSMQLTSGPQSSTDHQSGPRFLEIFQDQPVQSDRSGFATVLSLPARAMGIYLSAADSMLGAFNSLVSGYNNSLAGYARPLGNADPSQALPEILRILQGLVTQSANLTGQSSQLNNYLGSFMSSARNLALSQERSLRSSAGQGGIENILRGTGGKLRIITKKQIRDASKPEGACFSAIVGSTMRYSQPIDGAPFISDPLMPDPSGGIQIHLRSSEILDNLGLGLSRVDDGRRSAHSLRPVMPFWVKLNATYDSADCQAWRLTNTNWITDDYSPAVISQTSASSGSASLRSASSGSQSRLCLRPNVEINKTPIISDYSKLGSGACEEIEGPLKSANFGIWVYGLRAARDKVQGLCDDYLNNIQVTYKFSVATPPDFMLQLPQEKAQISPDDVYLLLIVTGFDALTGAGKKPAFNDLSDRVLTFAIPATCHRNADSDKTNDKFVLIPVYTFVEQDWDFVTEYEVYGRFAFKSVLNSPPYRWVEGAKGKQKLLTVHTNVFTGDKDNPQRAELKPVVEIWRPSMDSDTWEDQPRRNPDEFLKVVDINLNIGVKNAITNTYLQWLGMDKARELEVKSGESPAMVAGLRTSSAVAHPTPKCSIRTIGLKQVRDALQTSKASYQAIVGVNRIIEGGWEKVQTDDENLEVRFYNYQQMTIADNLGIRPTTPPGANKKTPPQTKLYDDYLFINTISGVRIYGQMSDQEAQTLTWTIEDGTDKWKPDLHADSEFFKNV
jgi:hypothetical protein